MLEIKIATLMNYVFGLISRLNTAEERISELEDRPTKIIQTEKRKKSGEKNRTEHLRAVAQYLSI